MTTLVIVESPAKAKTIAGYLGAGYTVRASMGHVRDLPERELGVDVAAGFAPTYVVPTAKRKTISDLRERARAAEAVLLATDPDREGEAIAWHLAQALGLRPAAVRRIEFHAITRDAVTAAVRRPRPLNQHLVDAQQARRVLDRLVGYQISPLLWRSVRRGLSAGRVQSVAVRLVVEREREIVAFEPREYWTITATFERTEGEPAERRPFEAQLAKIKGEKADIPDEATAKKLLAALADATYKVGSAETKPQQRHARPPFTTSTLQQEASRKLGSPVKATMSTAQSLYEGVDLGGGKTEGLITYMRTDSVAVAPEAQTAARAAIAERWGERYLPAKPPAHRTKTKGAQEAHEAIRPTDPRRDPESVRPHLTVPQYRLYRLIWQRFIASQMAPARLDVTTVDVGARTPRTRPEEPDPAIFRATGSIIRFPGFLVVYREGVDEGDDGLDEKQLPPLSAGNPLRALALTPKQHFTQPPPRFTEASLVKALEEQGIGRPSTYASIIATILDREYVARQEKALVPTPLGGVVTDLLVRHFPTVVDPGFTAGMEERLDDIADGGRGYGPVLADFYGPFREALTAAEAGMERVAPPTEPAGEDCPVCGQPMVFKQSKFGRFISCSAYPTCKATKPLVVRTGVTCPACREGELTERRAKQSGKPFWGCERYPACDFVTWWPPLPQPCPRCGGFLSAVGRAKRCLACDGPPPPPKPRARSRPAVGAGTASAAAPGIRAGSGSGRRRATKPVPVGDTSPTPTRRPAAPRGRRKADASGGAAPVGEGA